MKECLRCQKEFNAKRESAKFCSTNCRVQYNRVHGKKKAISTVQVQVLYNEILDMVNVVKKQGNGESRVVYHGNPIQASVVPRSQKTVQQFLNEISELEYEQEYRDKADEIEQAIHLTEKQRNLLILNLKSPKS